MQLRKGELNEDQYLDLMRERDRARRSGFQEEIGLDVLVHGEPERNDMVQYFAEQMDGYVVHRERAGCSPTGRVTCGHRSCSATSRGRTPMTVEWAKYAQSLTDRPMKGMLTGPVTMLMWSFVRDDQPRSETCKQLALAIRDEVADLEAGGVEIIQVDEPAIREGLPLRSDRWDEYLDWAVFTLPACYRRACATRPRSRRTCATRSSATSWTPISGAGCRRAADQAARSKMELLEDWKKQRLRQGDRAGRLRHPLPACAIDEEMVELLRRAARGADRRSGSGSHPTAASRRAATRRSSRRCATWSQAAKQLREELVPAGR